jgi:hypothetical protein
MLTKRIATRYTLLTVLLASVALLGQRQSTPGSSPAGLEFPVTMRQNVVAGTTPVGTKVQAKLAVATLVNAVVVPQDAILSGEITESMAASASGPSRLSIRMDSAQWKNRREPMVLTFASKVYLTAWYYPAVPPTQNQDLSSDLPESVPNPRPRTVSPAVRPGSKNTAQPLLPPVPETGTGTLPGPPAPASNISTHRVLMKNVEATRTHEGAIALTSKRANIKLDKTTTYVFAAGELASRPG